MMDQHKSEVRTATEQVSATERGQKLYINELRRRVGILWKNFLDYALICDLQPMEAILTAFEARCEDDGEALNLALCDVIYGCSLKQ
jgi:hypothetical protein